MRILTVCFLLALSVSVAFAQARVISANLSGTIATTGTFQSIQAASTTRNGCTVQNPIANTHNQWVYFGPIGSASEAASFELAPGQSIMCNIGGVLTLGDQVSITGTAADIFVANFQ